MYIECLLGWLIGDPVADLCFGYASLRSAFTRYPYMLLLIERRTGNDHSQI